MNPEAPCIRAGVEPQLLEAINAADWVVAEPGVRSQVAAVLDGYEIPYAF